MLVVWTLLINNFKIDYFFFSLLGTVGALFVCAVVAVKYSEGTHTVSKEFIE